MNRFSSDFITVISALGGMVGVIYATVQIVKGRSKYTEQSQCNEMSHEIKLMIDSNVKKGAEEISFLHEKINAISNRVSKIEGSLKL